MPHLRRFPVEVVVLYLLFAFWFLTSISSIGLITLFCVGREGFDSLIRSRTPWVFRLLGNKPSLSLSEASGRRATGTVGAPRAALTPHLRCCCDNSPGVRAVGNVRAPPPAAPRPHLRCRCRQGRGGQATGTARAPPPAAPRPQLRCCCRQGRGGRATGTARAPSCPTPSVPVLRSDRSSTVTRHNCAIACSPSSIISTETEIELIRSLRFACTHRRNSHGHGRKSKGGESHKPIS